MRRQDAVVEEILWLVIYKKLKRAGGGSGRKD